MMTCRAGATTTAGEHGHSQAGTACLPCQIAWLSGLSHQAGQWWPKQDKCRLEHVNPAGKPNQASRLLVNRQLSTL